MPRNYRRYEPAQSFGTICTSTSNSIWTSSPSSAARASTNLGLAYVGANETVLCWDVKTGELVSTWHDKDNRSAVTCISQCDAQPDLLAVGYNDGSIRVWDASSGQVVVTLNGHRGAVSLLRFDGEGSRLASGSRDTDVIVWNLLSETSEYRLRGHRDLITGLEFLGTPTQEKGEEEEKFLISTSKDALVKIWDLTTPYCMETHVAQTSGECWALGVSPDRSGCITAGNDGELRVWRLDLAALAELSSSIGEGKKQHVLQSQGIIHRQGKDRTIGVSFHPTQDYIAMHGSEKAVELWRIRSAEELDRHMKRKRRRRREKAAAAGETLAPEKEEALETPDVGDVFIHVVNVRTGGKVRSVNWITSGTKASKFVQILTANTNNQLEVYNVESAKAQEKAARKDPDYTRSLAVELPGHRSDIRTLALSSDDRMLASASKGLLKIWNLRTQSCLRTLECGEAICSTFLPGDRMVLLGTGAGELELYDISTSSLIEKMPAHDGKIWALAVHPDGRSVATGSEDKTVKFWRFDVVDEEIPGTRRTTQRLKLTQTRLLKAADAVLAACFSPDQKYLAISTVDSKVYTYFVDSLKQYHILYGHKLPVLSVSISSDSKLVATASADKNVRIWGLDFGDCHKAFFAHQDNVMACGFIPHPVEQEEKHMLFSVGKDGVVKSWDADKFEQIQKLEGHHGEIWAMAVSQTGETVVTAAHDKSIRVWRVGDDLIFLEEERERELEEMYESTLAQNMDRDFHGDEEQDAEVGAATKQTISTLTHGEKIMEALDVALADLELMQQYELDKAQNPKLAPPQDRNPIFSHMNMTAEQHVLQTLRQVPSAALNDALLVIPFATLPALFRFLAIFLRKRMQPASAWRISYFMLQAHMTQIVASKQLKGVLTEIYDAYDAWVEEERKVLGFNLVALNVMCREARETENMYLDEKMMGEEEEEAGGEKGRKKRAFGSVA